MSVLLSNGRVKQISCGCALLLTLYVYVQV